MSAAEEEERERLLKQFKTYDTTVDVVSSLEAVLNHIYNPQFDNFYFDRFPSPSVDGREITPDFTVYFDENYGLVGEITRTFPDDEHAIVNTELEQLSHYDNNIELCRGDGEYAAPDTCDIMVLIEGADAPQIGTRLNRILLDEVEVEFSKNVVLMRYQFNHDAINSRYEFQRVTQMELEFRDDELDADPPVSELVGEQGDYNTLRAWPKHFIPFKARRPICNDSPPGVYLATFLWHKIFPQYLTGDQYQIWQATNGQREIPIALSVDDLTAEVNDFMKDGQVRRRWVRDALRFLCDADLANEQEGGFEVRFMGLVQNRSSENRQEGTQEREEIRELGDTFIRRYCENSSAEEDQTGESTGSAEAASDGESGDVVTSDQAGLDEFL